MHTTCTPRPGPRARWLVVMLCAALGGCDPGAPLPAAGQPVMPTAPPVPDHVMSTLEDTILRGTLPPATGLADPVTYTLHGDAHGGNVKLAQDGTFIYTPDADFHGTDGFRYRVRDARGRGPVYRVQISVLPVNDAPRIRPGTAPVIPVSSGRMAVVPGSGEGNAVAVDAEGRIHVAGSLHIDGRDQIAVARYTADGVLDLGYGGGDGIATAFIGMDASACRVVMDGAGRSVVAIRGEAGGRAVLTLARFTAEGELDTTFGAGSGLVTTPVGAPFPAAFGLALDGQGRLLAAGASSGYGSDVFTVARYSAAGELDATFGNGGVVTTAIGTGISAARDIAVDKSGRLVVVGYSKTQASQYSRDAMTIVRYTGTGILDPTFGGGNGFVTTSYPFAGLVPSAMALDDAGRIVVAGHLHGECPFGGSQRPIVARYTADGELDASFGEGIVEIWYGEFDDWSSGADVALDSRGNVLVTGTSWGYVRQVSAVVRYTDSGVLDAGFGSGTGIVATAFGFGAAGRGITLDSSGRVLVAGSVRAGSHNAMTVARYLDEGILDPAFNGGGDETFWFPVDRRFHDVDGDDLTYTVSLAGGVLAPELNFDAQQLVVSGKLPADATALVVTATDPQGLSATESYEFLRTSAN